MVEIELSNGTILEVPDGTAPEAMRNYALRAEAKLKSAADNQAARDQQQAAPAEPTNMFGGTPLLDRFGLKGLREGASSVLNTETGIPAFIGRGALSRNPLVGGADLAATGINMAARGTPLDAVAPGGEVFGAPDTGVLSARGGPPAQVPIPSQVIGNAIGLPQQNADTGTAEKVLESIISFGRSGTPLATGAAGVRAASPMVQRATNLAGQAAGGTASYFGSEYGGQAAEALGLDPTIGVLLGGLAGGTVPSAVNNVPARLAT